jgi:serine/threonine-protein kinase
MASEALPKEIMEFRPLRLLGRGGTGCVYEVTDKQGRHFALKHIIRKSEKDDRYIEQTLREHHVSLLLNHPCVRKTLRVYRKRTLAGFADFKRTWWPFVDSEVVIVMELVEGETLEQHPLDNLAEVCRVLKEVSSVLAEMHKRGYIHGDLKPVNIMFTPKGDVRIIDLGLASPVNSVKTRIHGTPGFIAPEQVLCKPLTQRTDVYCFGATMYRMLTGEHVPTMIPNKSKEIPRSFRDEDVDLPPCTPPHEINPAIPPALSMLVMNCINRKPADRPESMTVVAERLGVAIQQIIRSSSLAGPTLKPPAAKSDPKLPKAGADTGSKDAKPKNESKLGVPVPKKARDHLLD